MLVSLDRNNPERLFNDYFPRFWTAIQTSDSFSCPHLDKPLIDIQLARRSLLGKTLNIFLTISPDQWIHPHWDFEPLTMYFSESSSLRSLLEFPRHQKSRDIILIARSIIRRAIRQSYKFLILRCGIIYQFSKVPSWLQHFQNSSARTFLTNCFRLLSNRNASIFRFEFPPCYQPFLYILIILINRMAFPL